MISASARVGAAQLEACHALGTAAARATTVHWPDRTRRTFTAPLFG